MWQYEVYYGFYVCWRCSEHDEEDTQFDGIDEMDCEKGDARPIWESVADGHRYNRRPAAFYLLTKRHKHSTRR